MSDEAAFTLPVIVRSRTVPSKILNAETEVVIVFPLPLSVPVKVDE